MSKANEYPIVTFSDPEDWEKWLAENHDKFDGVWLRFYKKNSGIATMTYDQALEVAMCYGWIDGQKKSYDEKSYMLKYTPRRKNSIWSKRNTEIATMLIEQKRMKPSGLAQVEAAKLDGRWDQAYDSPGNSEVPQDFIDELKKDKKAYEFFKTLNKTNTYAIAWRLQTAKKPETRERRKQALLEMMRNGQKLH